MSLYEPLEASARDAHRAQPVRAYPLPDPRLDALQASIAARLRQAGVILSAEAFAALVLDMARFALHWSDAEVAARGPRGVSALVRVRRTPPRGVAAQRP